MLYKQGLSVHIKPTKVQQMGSGILGTILSKQSVYRWYWMLLRGKGLQVD